MHIRSIGIYISFGKKNISFEMSVQTGKHLKLVNLEDAIGLQQT